MSGTMLLDNQRFELQVQGFRVGTCFNPDPWKKIKTYRIGHVGGVWVLCSLMIKDLSFGYKGLGFKKSLESGFMNEGRDFWIGHGGIQVLYSLSFRYKGLGFKKSLESGFMNEGRDFWIGHGGIQVLYSLSFRYKGLGFKKSLESGFMNEGRDFWIGHGGIQVLYSLSFRYKGLGFKNSLCGFHQRRSRL